MRKSRTALFLMEMIVIMFFFSLTAAVCIRVFVKAHLVGRDTKDLNNAVLLAENAGELFYEYGEDFKDHENEVRENLPEGYSVELTTSDDGDFMYLDFAYYSPDKEEPVYTLTYKKNIQEVRGK
ncbi:MAG: hypothetical protein J6X36_08920 [Lachnospiraceae bacterium]|jgi:hypothetical protein|nr:hypothetical protein [Lachnospiraceae bacterium]